MATVNEKMTAIADEIRAKTGSAEPLTLDDMAAAIPKVFDEGKKTQYDEFWDTYQNYGALEIYQYAFGGEGWTDDLFKPKYDLIGTTFFRCFAYSGVKTINKVVDASQSTASSVLNQTFYASSVETIKELRVAPHNTFSQTFHVAYDLKNLNVTGAIGQNGFEVQYSTKLTHESLMSIINALKDYSGSNETYTITLGTVNLAKLSDEEKALATQKGWTLA